MYQTIRENDRHDGIFSYSETYFLKKWFHWWPVTVLYNISQRDFVFGIMQILQMWQNTIVHATVNGPEIVVHD